MNSNDLLSIKEFSKFTGLKESTLRYYDEIGLFSPVLRGDNNYRYYSVQQIITVNLINVLASLDIPRKEIIKMSKERDPDSILKLFSEQEEILTAQIRRISESHAIIQTFRRLIEEGNRATEGVIYECEMPSMSISLGPDNHFPKDAQFYQTFMKYCANAKNLNINLSYPIGGYYNDIDALTQNPSQPSNFFSITPDGKSKKPAGHYLVGHIRGYYGDMGDLPQRLCDYAKAHDFSLKGPLYAIYLHDEITSLQPTEYLVQISALIKK